MPNQVVIKLKAAGWNRILHRRQRMKYYNSHTASREGRTTMRIAPPDYTITAVIYEGKKSRIFRARRKADQQAVILKLLKAEYPRPAELAAWETEYAVLTAINSDYVVKCYGREPYQNTVFLVLEDFGGQSLQQWLNGRPLPLPEFFRLGGKITVALEQIHQHNIIYQNMSPRHIIYNPVTGNLKIIDFSVAGHPGPAGYPGNAEKLTASLPYLAPEQTERLNRGVDRRTDLYSLGVTFYEMLTGKLPFTAAPAEELVYCHLAVTPAPIHQHNPAIPAVVSAMIQKLLAKDPEDRYQSAAGVAHDLAYCQRQLSFYGHINDFSPGSNDFTGLLPTPPKLYGREKETADLLAVLTRSHQYGPELLLITGPPGVGKSALVNQLAGRVAEKNGRFLRGKFDQLLKNNPYHAWVQAFNEFVNQLLTEDTGPLRQWQSDILTAAGRNGKVLTNLIPGLELIIGKPAAIPPLDPEEALNRFHHVVKKFITAITAQTHPLIIFLDDLQWADLNSLRLLDFLLTGQDIPQVLLIGAYRDNEVGPAHPLTRLLTEAGQKKLPVTTWRLTNLAAAAVGDLVADTLRASPAATADLAGLIFAKTRGNPFFVRQFLHTLHHADLLRWEPVTAQWHWDLARIQQLHITDNVVELLTVKLRELAGPAQTVLKAAAGLGHRFTREFLPLITGQPAPVITDYLQTAVAEGLLIVDHQEYIFAHDRIQQAVYNLSDEPERRALHLKTGRLLLRHTPPEKLPERLFDIVDQLNLAADSIDNPAEKVLLATLNLRAGRLAKSSAAFTAALNYLLAGLHPLPPDSWQSHYQLTLALYSQAVEAAYLSGDFRQTEELAQIVLNNARTLLDKILIYKVQAQVCRAKNRLLDAIHVLLPALTALGIDLPSDPAAVDIRPAIAETMAKLSGRQIEDLTALPKMTAPDQLAAMELLATLRPLTYQIYPELLPLTILAGINLTLDYGNAPLSASAYSGFGMILCGVTENIDTGYRFGRLALRVLTRLDAAKVECKVLFAFNTFVRHYKEPFRETLPSLQKAAYAGLETGDLEYASMAAFAYGLFCLFSGETLANTSQAMAAYGDLIRNTRQETACRYAAIYRQLVHNLREPVADPDQLAGEFCQPDNLLATFRETKNRMGLSLLYFARSVGSYWFGKYEQAAVHIGLSKKYLAGLTASPFVPLAYFYDSLIALTGYSRATADDRATILATVAANQEKMRLWADQAPMNYRARYYLVEAERLRALDQDLDAMDRYDQAIDQARQTVFIHLEGLAYELAAGFYLARGRIIIARAYIREACYRYTRWGAAAKIRQLAEKYPTLLPDQPPAVPGEPPPPAKFASAGQVISEHIDMTAIMKAALVISKELDITVLYQKMLRLMINNAGAERGCLLLEKSGRFLPAARDPANSFNAAGDGDAPRPLLPTAIINYVAHTGTKVVLADAQTDPMFGNSPYVKERPVRSLLCLPLFNRGRLTGLMYLENNAASDVFTEKRVRVLEILLAQLSISIENARFYAGLEQKIKGRTAELETVVAELEKLTGKKAPRQPEPAVSFTNREKEILHLVALGQTNKEISKTLSISLATVKSHIHNLLSKTETTSRTALIARELHTLTTTENQEPTAAGGKTRPS